MVAIGSEVAVLSAGAFGLVTETALNVADFGAVGNGTTDDSAAINAAFAAAKTAGGGAVFFPFGVNGIYLCNSTCLLTTAVDLSLPLYIFGAGATLKTTAAIPILKLIATGSGNLRRIIVSGLSFQVNNAGATGIQTRGAAYNFYENLDFSGSGTAMDIGTGTGADLSNQLTNIRITQPGRGILVNGIGNVLTNIIVGEGISGADAINLAGSGNVLDGFFVRGAGGTGGLGTVVNTGAYTSITNGHILNAYSDGLYIAAGRGNRVTSVSIESPVNNGLRLSGTIDSICSVILVNVPATFAGVRVDFAATDNIITAGFDGSAQLHDFFETSATAARNSYRTTLLQTDASLASTTATLQTNAAFSLPVGVTTTFLGPTKLSGTIGIGGATPVSRDTGWAAATNTKTKTTFDTTTVTLPVLAAHVGALIDMLIARGDIGA